MPKFTFIVDKQTCFIYWLQSLVKWGVYFEKRQNEYYLNQIGYLSQTQNATLDAFKNFLQKEDTGFIWLWNAYAGKLVFEKEGDQQMWSMLEELFLPIFEKVWQVEETLLLAWKDKLSAYDFSQFEQELSKTRIFLGDSNKNENINIKLFSHWDSFAPYGHSHRNHSDLLILNISNVDMVQMQRVANVIIHEFLHIIENTNPPALVQIKNTIKECIQPIQSKENVSWRYLMVESVFNTIAGRRYNNYFGRILSSSQKEIEADLSFDFDISNDRHNYELLIRKVAAQMEPLTKEYMDNSKPFGKPLAELFAQAWIDLLQGIVK